MRPDPPEPDTENTGRTRKYRPLVDPREIEQKEDTTLGAVLFTVFILVLFDVFLRLWF